MDNLEKRVSGSGSGESKMREQGELRELGGGRQCWKTVKDELGVCISRATDLLGQLKRKGNIWLRSLKRPRLEGQA